MARVAPLLLALALAGVSAVLPAQGASRPSSGSSTPPGPDGAIVARTPCAPLRPYAAARAALAETRARGVLALPLPDSAEYVRLVAVAVCERITYWSDGLRVVAILARPRATAGRQFPLVVFNHGSTAARGALPERIDLWQARLVARGYVVLAPQYRGGGGSEGADEFGGADVHDVLNIFPVAGALGFVDLRNAFMHGHSRGGAMTYLAIKAGAPIRAAVVSAGVADFAARSAYTPWVRDSVDRQLMPNFAQREAEHYEARSAVRWPERLTVPIQIIHGTADDRVPATSALDLAMRLQRLGRPYELVIFAGGTHGLEAHRAELERRVAEWFDAHRQP